MARTSKRETDEHTNLEASYMVHIHSLPDPIILDIFSRLNFSDLCICSRVCQRWYMHSRDFTLRKLIIIKEPLTSNQFSSLVQHHFNHSLEEFQLLGHSQKLLMCMKRNLLWNISFRSTNLKKLVLMFCSLSSVSLNDFPSCLTHLSIRASEIYPHVFFGPNPNRLVPNLVCLDIGRVSNFLTSEDLHVFSTLKSLRALYMEGCFRINNGGIESIIDILPQLEILDVEWTDISNEGAVTIFNHCSNIKQLFIGHTPINDELFLSVGSNVMPLLSTFCVTGTNISSRGLLSFISHCLTQKKLSLKADFDVTDSCKSFNIVISPIVSPVDHKLPDNECQHYLTRKW